MDLWCDQAPSPAFSPLNRDNPLNRDTLNRDTTVLCSQSHSQNPVHFLCSFYLLLRRPRVYPHCQVCIIVMEQEIGTPRWWLWDTSRFDELHDISPDLMDRMASVGEPWLYFLKGISEETCLLIWNRAFFIGGKNWINDLSCPLLKYRVSQNAKLQPNTPLYCLFH